MFAKIILFIFIVLLSVYVKTEELNKTQISDIQKEQIKRIDLILSDTTPKNSAMIKPVRENGADNIGKSTSTEKPLPSTLTKPTVETTTINKGQSNIVPNMGIDHREEKENNIIGIKNANISTSTNLTGVNNSSANTSNIAKQQSTIGAASTTSITTSSTSTSTTTTTTTSKPISTTTSTKPTTTTKPKKPKITISLEDDPNLLRQNEENLKKKLSEKLANKNDKTSGVEEPKLQFLKEAAFADTPVSNHRDLVIPLITLIFAVPIFVGLGIVAFRRAKDYWMTRHYSRMDFLVDGMYNY